MRVSTNYVSCKSVSASTNAADFEKDEFNEKRYYLSQPSLLQEP
ncbi:Uncharacterised protein [Serratia grimesii]|nr:Uncharacterised protein [Serratia grimesii]